MKRSEDTRGRRKNKIIEKRRGVKKRMNRLVRRSSQHCQLTAQNSSLDTWKEGREGGDSLSFSSPTFEVTRREKVYMVVYKTKGF